MRIRERNRGCCQASSRSSEQAQKQLPLARNRVKYSTAAAHPSRARRSQLSRCRAPRCGPPAQAKARTQGDGELHEGEGGMAGRKQTAGREGWEGRKGRREGIRERSGQGALRGRRETERGERWGGSSKSTCISITQAGNTCRHQTQGRQTNHGTQAALQLPN